MSGRQGVLHCRLWIFAVVLLLFSQLPWRSAAAPVHKSRKHSDFSKANRPYDAFYILGLADCKSRWRHARKWATSHKLDIVPVYATKYSEMDMTHPPIPVINAPANASIKAGQIGCTMTHIRIWRDAFKRNYSRIIVLEDDVYLTEEAVANLGNMFNSADAGSVARGEQWHYIYLRSEVTVYYSYERETWHDAVWKAHPAWGTAAYALSWHGIRFLLTRITTYSYPLDVQIERLQRGHDTQGAKFVALDSCPVDRTHSLGCPENVRELTNEEKGNCWYSASQSGIGSKGKHFPSIKRQRSI